LYQQNIAGGIKEKLPIKNDEESSLVAGAPDSYRDEPTTINKNHPKVVLK
jgi:hypothetical protein